jgi:hypothetical protein
MKITKQYLRQVIKEELEKALEEGLGHGAPRAPRSDSRFGGVRRITMSPEEKAELDAKNQAMLDNTAETREYTQAIERYVGYYPNDEGGQPEDLEAIKAFEAAHGGPDGAFAEVAKKQAESYGVRGAGEASRRLTPAQEGAIGRQRKQRAKIVD